MGPESLGQLLQLILQLLLGRLLLGYVKAARNSRGLGVPKCGQVAKLFISADTVRVRAL